MILHRNFHLLVYFQYYACFCIFEIFYVELIILQNAVTNMPRRSISNVQDDGLTCLQNAGNISESIHLATSHTTNTWMLQSQNYNSLIRSSRITTTPIFIKDFLANISSYMKSQTQMSLIRIIVVLLVIILMQVNHFSSMLCLFFNVCINILFIDQTT